MVWGVDGIVGGFFRGRNGSADVDGYVGIHFYGNGVCMGVVE